MSALSTVRTGTDWAINDAKLSFVQLGVMAHYLRMLLSGHVNYLLLLRRAGRAIRIGLRLLICLMTMPS